MQVLYILPHKKHSLSKLGYKAMLEKLLEDVGQASQKIARLGTTF